MMIYLMFLTLYIVSPYAANVAGLEYSAMDKSVYHAVGGRLSVIYHLDGIPDRVVRLHCVLTFMYIADRQYQMIIF